MNTRHVLSAAIVFSLVLCAARRAEPAAVDFARDIQPILKQHCVKCHSGPSAKGGLSLDTMGGLMKGGKSRDAVVPGSPAKSRLFRRVNLTDARRMPLDAAPLSKKEIASIRNWIAQEGVVKPIVQPPSADVIRQAKRLIVPIRSARNTTDPSVKCVVAVGPPVAISALAFSSNGKTLAVGGYREVLLWDTDSGKLRKRLGAGQLSGPVHAVAFCKGDHRLAVGDGAPSVSGAVTVFDVETGQVASRFEGPKDVVYSVALSPDGKLLAAAAADYGVYLWNIDEKTAVTSLREHRGAVRSVAFSPDGKLLAAAGADGMLQIWATDTWKSVNKVQQTDPIQGVVFSPDGDNLAWAVGGASERTILVRRTETLQEIAPVKSAKPKKKAANTPATKTLDPAGAMPLDIAWSADAVAGGKVFIPCDDKTVKVFNPFGGLTAVLGGHGDWVYGVAVSPDGKRLASGSADGTVKLWNVADNRLLATLVQLAPRADDWLVLTPLGYFTGSSSTAVRWQTENVKTSQEQLTRLFENADKVRELLAGSKSVGPPALQ